MAIDIYHSRRMNFRKCVFWLPTEKRDWNEWIMRKEPTGVFYAREISAFSKQGNEIQNAFMFDKTSVTLETNDNLEKLTKGCIIKYLNDLWIVDSIQAQAHIKESEFTGEIAGTYVINIRK